MRISVSEWSALRLAVKLPPALVNPELFAAAVRKHARTRRGMAVAGCVLLIVLVVLHVKTASPEVKRLSDLVAELAGVKLIDARWDAAVAQARSQAQVSSKSVVHNTDAARIQNTLQAAERDAKTTALRTALADLRKAYVEKADVVSRFEKASADTRSAVAAAMRADVAVMMLVRSAWRDFPQRDRLVAAENLVVRVIAEAQQYHYTPTATTRANLESYMVDLTRGQTLPKPVQTGLAQLGSDVHQLLLLKPLEHMLGERLTALDTAQRIDQVTELYQRDLADALATRDRWRLALMIYTAALIALLVYLGIRAIARFRDLEVLYARQTRLLAKVLQKLKAHGGDLRTAAAPRRDAGAVEEEAHVVSEHRRQAGP